MNRIHFIGLILVSIISFSCNKNDIAVHNELKEWKLKGKVRSISEINYSGTGKYTTYLQFNPNGFIQEQSSFNPDGSLIRRWKFEYNDRSLKLARSCYVLNDSLSEILHFSYNENDKIIEERLLDSQGGLISDVEHEYDVDQNEIEKRFKDENEKIQGRISFKYDNNNNIIEVISSNSILSQNWKQKYIYNSEELNVEILYLTLNDSLLKRSTYTYLPNRQVYEACFYNNNKNELISKTTYKYNSQLSVTSKLTYYPFDKKTEKRTFEYEYDKNKNWTSLKEYINNEPGDIIIREFEYYK